MKEVQAKTKWCPFARVIATTRGNKPGTESPTYNRALVFATTTDAKVEAAGHTGAQCFGSECMAWRWAEPLFDGDDSYVSEPAPEGYCGLAGKPK